MDVVGLGHFYTALLALLSGAIVVFNRKGTRFHRWMGRTYFAAMLAVNISALTIYDLFGSFGPFHAGAIFSLLTVLAGVAVVWFRQPGKPWREGHAYWMCWSYVGLCAAAVAETSTRYLDFDFGWTVGISSMLVVVIGAMLINRKIPPLLRPAKAGSARTGQQL